MTDAFRESSVVANGVRLHYATAGRGPLVLLLHGFPERWFSWRAQIPAIAAAGYRVVAPDLRGYGLSDRPASGYEITNLAQDVASLVVALGEESAAVIGHDWGAAITWEAVSRFPARVSRYAVLDCPHPEVLHRATLRSLGQFRRSAYMLFFSVPWLPEHLIARDGGRAVERIFRRNALDPSRFTREVLRPFRESAATPAAVRPMMAYYRSVVREALGPGLAPYPVIERPGLLLWAENDPVFPTGLVAPHTRVARNLRIRKVPRCGHFVQQEQPEVVSRLLTEWLEDTREPKGLTRS